MLLTTHAESRHGGTFMDDQGLALVKAINRQEIERHRQAGELGPLPWEEPTIPYTELPELPLENWIYREWNTYRFVVGKYLAVGLEGAWLSIKADSVIGVYPNARMACSAIANEPQEVRDSILIKQVLANERASTLQRLKLRCPSSPIPLAKTA